MKPNAPLEKVLSRLEVLTKDFTKNDFVIAIGGCNDISADSPYQYTLLKMFNRLSTLGEKTNVIFPYIFYRYDFPQINEHIYVANTVIRNYTAKNSNKVILLGNAFRRHHYTKQGLHLNQSGKRLMARYFFDYITKCVSTTVSFLALNNLKNPTT